MKTFIRPYSTIIHTPTHRVFHKHLKNKINVNPSILPQDELRKEIALYIINNKNIYHKNNPDILYELQKFHKNQYKKLQMYKEKVENDLIKINSSDHNLLNSLLLSEINDKLEELLSQHRKEIRKVNEVKHHSPDFWTFKLPEE